MQTVTDLLLKGYDPHLALVAYRDTPGINEVSPAHPSWTNPCKQEFPRLCSSSSHSGLLPPSTWVVTPVEGSRSWTSTEGMRLTHNPLSSLGTSSRVLVPGPAQRPRSHVVGTPKAVIQRNRLHLVPLSRIPVPKDPVEPATEEHPESEPSVRH